MRKLTLLLIFTIGVFSTAFSQTESSLLWKINGNGLEKPSYVYGTIHVICPQDYIMADKVKKAFSESDQVYLELDFDDPEMMQKIMGLSMLGNGKTAKDYLSEEEYKLLDEKFNSAIGIPMAQLQVMKPLMLLSMSYMAIIKCQPMSFETVFSNMAKTENKELKGLETIEYQMSIFDKIPYTLQYKMIADLLKKEIKAQEEFNALIALYKKEDIDGLLNSMHDSEWNLEDFEESLIYNRNKEWVEKFDKIANEKSTFIAVGAGHLAGEKGFLNLLKEKGYTVEAVK